MQLAFLVVVETPHMDKIYGEAPPAESAKELKSTGFVKEKEPSFLFDLDWRQDSGLICSVALYSVLCFVVDNPYVRLAGRGRADHNHACPNRRSHCGEMKQDRL